MFQSESCDELEEVQNNNKESNPNALNISN